MAISRAKTIHDDDIAAGADATAKLPVTGVESLLVIWEIRDSDAVGNLVTVRVRPYTPADFEVPVLIDNFIPETAVAAARRVNPVTTRIDRYDVRGLEQVHLTMTNSSASTRNLLIHVYLYS